MNTNKNTMTDCELQVMKVIWESDKLLTLPEILACVNQKYGKEWKAPTVSTFLARLVRKDFLSMQRTGRTFIYDSLVSEKDYRGRVINDCVKFWSGGNVGDFLLALQEERPLNEDEVGKIKTLLARHK